MLDVPRPAGPISTGIAGALGIGGMLLAAVTRWELAMWATGMMILGGLALLAVLFARSEAPARRLRGLIRAWRNPAPLLATVAVTATS